MTTQAIRTASILLVAIAAGAFGWLTITALFATPGDHPPLVIEESDDMHEDQVVMGRSIKIIGHVRGGVLSLGGDVIVTGSVEGDVAAVGGSVVQTAGSHISGDVLVVGGNYKHIEGQSCRGVGTTTVVYSGSGEHLREFFANPTRQLIAPSIDRTFIGWRIAVALSSFVLAMILVGLAPKLISRASERLASDSLRIAAIGLVGTLVAILLTGLALVTLPTPAAAIISGVLLVVLVVVQVLGRVVAYFFVGRWLQRKLLGENHRSQTIALLLGVVTLAILGSLPVLGALLVFATFILSVGIMLTMPTPHQP